MFGRSDGSTTDTLDDAKRDNPREPFTSQNPCFDEYYKDSNGCEMEAIKPIPWYPANLAWQSNFSGNQLRKNQTLERFHEFLKLENEIGNITRRESVSMVPPLFLDVHPQHFVLDMCAAPGSKTFQLLEMIHKLTEPGKLPCGMIIANDLDVQRFIKRNERAPPT